MDFKKEHIYCCKEEKEMVLCFTMSESFNVSNHPSLILYLFQHLNLTHPTVFFHMAVDDDSD